MWGPVSDGETITTCPLLATTGVPCPACGGTRAFVYFLHGDTAFLNYNWFWLLLWLAGVVIAVLALVRLARGRPAIGPRVRAAAGWWGGRGAGWRVPVTVVGVLALGWSVAMLNLAAIGVP